MRKSTATSDGRGDMDSDGDSSSMRRLRQRASSSAASFDFSLHDTTSASSIDFAMQDTTTGACDNVVVASATMGKSTATSDGRGDMGSDGDSSSMRRERASSSAASFNFSLQDTTAASSIEFAMQDTTTGTCNNVGIERQLLRRKSAPVESDFDYKASLRRALGECRTVSTIAGHPMEMDARDPVMPAEEDPAAMDVRDTGSPQQFCLRWHNYQNNLTNCFDQLRTDQFFVDVTLACDGQSLKAHKVVLSACSPYFQALLVDNPCQHPIIIIRDIKYEDLKAAVDFMYRGEINVSQEQIPALLKVADTLKIRGLTDVNGEQASLPGDLPARGAKRAGSPVSPEVRRRRGSEEPARARSPQGTPPSDPLPRPEPSPAPPLAPHDDVDIRPGIAEMIREEERARMLENTQAWMGASTSTALAGQLAETYQYRMQSLWQQCWSTNQNMVHNLRLRERGPLKSWRPETMAEAIFSVLKEGLSLSQAARKYDIPYPTFVLYANRVHNMLGPSADGGADLRPKGRGRPQRILLGVWPDDHIRGVIRAVVFRENHTPHTTHHLREVEMPLPYPAITDGVNQPPPVTVGGNGCGNGREGRVSPNAAAAAAVAAVAHGLRRQMCNMVVAAQRPQEHPGHVGLPPLPLHSPRLPSPLTAGLESPLCSPPPPGHALEPTRPAEPFRPFASPRPDSRYSDRDINEMGPPKTPVSRNGQGASPIQADPSVTDGARLDI